MRATPPHPQWFFMQQRPTTHSRRQFSSPREPVSHSLLKYLISTALGIEHMDHALGPDAARALAETCRQAASPQRPVTSRRRLAC